MRYIILRQFKLEYWSGSCNWLPFRIERGNGWCFIWAGYFTLKYRRNRGKGWAK